MLVSNDASSTGISALGLKIDGDKLIGFSGSIAGATKNLVAAPRSIANVEWAGKIFKGEDVDVMVEKVVKLLREEAKVL